MELGMGEGDVYWWACLDLACSWPCVSLWSWLLLQLKKVLLRTAAIYQLARKMMMWMDI